MNKALPNALLETIPVLDILLPDPKDTYVLAWTWSNWEALPPSPTKIMTKTSSWSESVSGSGKVIAAIDLPKVIDPASLKPFGTKETEVKLKQAILEKHKLGQDEFLSKKDVKVILNWFTLNSKLEKKAHFSWKIPSSWVFEGQFPIKVVDMSDWIIATWNGITQQTSISDHSGTPNMVNFSAQMDLKIPAVVKEWYLILISDNPSGLADRDDSVKIKIKF